MISSTIILFFVYFAVSNAAQIYFNLTSVPQQYRFALRQCSALAEKEWNSSIETRVKIEFSSLPNRNVLATARTTNFVRYRSSYYTMAMAKRLHRKDLNRDSIGLLRYDMLLKFNDAHSWYGGGGKTPSDQFDLITVCMHEVAHGLFLTTNNIAMTQKEGGTYDGRFYVNSLRRYDRFLACETDRGDCALASFRNNPRKFGQCITRNSLWFRTNSTRVAKLYAPKIYHRGSSVSHLHTTYLGDNRTLKPVSVTGVAWRTFGPLAKQIIAALIDQAERGAPLCGTDATPIFPKAPVSVEPVSTPVPKKKDSDKSNDTLVITLCAIGTVFLLVSAFIFVRLLRKDDQQFCDCYLKLPVQNTFLS